MREMIGRLTRCGIPEITALCVANEFEKRDRLDALAAYALAVEEQHERE